jgi:hypothetical protein
MGSNFAIFGTHNPLQKNRIPQPSLAPGPQNPLPGPLSAGPGFVFVFPLLCEAFQPLDHAVSVTISLNPASVPQKKVKPWPYRNRVHDWSTRTMNTISNASEPAGYSNFVNSTRGFGQQARDGRYLAAHFVDKSSIQDVNFPGAGPESSKPQSVSNTWAPLPAASEAHLPLHALAEKNKDLDGKIRKLQHG